MKISNGTVVFEIKTAPNKTRNFEAPLAELSGGTERQIEYARGLRRHRLDVAESEANGLLKATRMKLSIEEIDTNEAARRFDAVYTALRQLSANENASFWIDQRNNTRLLEHAAAKLLQA